MIRKRQVEIEEDIPPFVMMRVGILEHIQNKWMTSDMFMIYWLILHLCDWETGVWHGSAGAIRAELNYIWGERKIERVMKLLVDRRYLVSKYRKGETGNYDILVNNFTPTKGPHAMKVKLRQVAAGNPLTTDKTDVKSVAAKAVASNLSSGLTVTASEQTASASIQSPKMSSNQYVFKNPSQEGQDGIDGCMDSKAAPKGFDLEEA